MPKLQHQASQAHLHRQAGPKSKEIRRHIPAAGRMAEITRAMTKVNCEFVSKKNILIANKITAEHLFRIAQEAVSNALKHSHAKKICIVLTENASHLELTVSDNGRGFKLSAGQHGGMGLRLLKYRANVIDAKLSIASAPAKGTRVVCSLHKIS